MNKDNNNDDDDDELVGFKTDLKRKIEIKNMEIRN